MLKPGDEICLKKIIVLAETIITLLELSDNLGEGIENINVSLLLLKKIERSASGIIKSLNYEKSK